MLGYVAIVHIQYIFDFLNSFFIQGKERPAKTKLLPAKKGKMNADTCESGSPAPVEPST